MPFCAACPRARKSSAGTSLAPRKILTELPGAGDFTEVLLEVDSSSGELASVRIRQAGGIELEYRSETGNKGLPLPEEMFAFRPPPALR